MNLANLKLNQIDVRLVYELSDPDVLFLQF